MTCPLCGTRKARRACPGLGHQICTVCCGTKRLTEIACPADCVYLSRARAHPPAAVARQRERDFRFAYPLVEGLSENGYRVLLVTQQVVARHRKVSVPPLTDLDVAAAAAAMASTLETAARGIIYDHQAPSLSAQRLVVEMKSVVAALAEGAGPGLDRDAATAFRRIEAGARRGAEAFEGAPTGYLDFIERLPAELASAIADDRMTAGHEDPPTEANPASRIILP